jgi:hypothetical protein
LERLDVREIIIDNYRLVYRHTDDVIHIVAFWHGSSDLASRLRRIDLD